MDQSKSKYQYLLKLLEKSDGRDKILKLIQHLSALILRLGKIFPQSNPFLLTKLFNLYKATGDARKYLRLLKFLVEYKQMREILKSQHQQQSSTAQIQSPSSQVQQSNLTPGKVDEFSRMSQIAIRLNYMLYWFYDNLHTLGLFFGRDEKFRSTQLQRALRFRLYGIVLSLILSLRNFMRLHHSEIKLRHKLQYVKNENENISTVQQIRQMKERKHQEELLFIKILGDSLLSFSGLKLTEKYFLNKQLPKIMVNVGGLTSAFITLYFLL